MKFLHYIVRLLHREPSIATVETPVAVIDACNTIRARFGDMPSLEEIREIVEIYRQKTIVRLYLRLPNDAAGGILPLPGGHDVVVLQEHLGVVIEVDTELHEYGHLFLGHIAHENPELPELPIFLQNPYKYLKHAIFRAQLGDKEKEHEAEAFARSHFSGAYHRKYIASDISFDIYGE